VTRPARIASVAFHPLADKLGIVRVTTERSPARLAALVARVAEGKLAVSVERGYRLGEAAEAHRRMETGHVRGKIVFQLGPE
jgi:enoyl reductase